MASIQIEIKVKPDSSDRYDAGTTVAEVDLPLPRELNATEVAGLCSRIADAASHGIGALSVGDGELREAIAGALKKALPHAHIVDLTPEKEERADDPADKQAPPEPAKVVN